MEKTYSITPLNESAALVSFGNIIDESVNQKVIFIYQSLNNNSFRGYIESVPAYSSITVFYNPVEVIQSNGKSAFDFVRECLESTLKQTLPEIEKEKRIIEIPVLYNGDDLEFVANHNQQTRDEVIKIHTSKKYNVFMVGFLPGFPYMGILDQRIAAPRKNSPRISVPSGSVGIAGSQTGIYPLASPGGWQLIGRTPVKIFDKEKSKPCVFNPGDNVRFYSIDQNEFEKLNEY